jgi:hypothetical protein
MSVDNGWPFTVAINEQSTGFRRVAIVKQLASAIRMSWAARSDGSSLSNEISVMIPSQLLAASPFMIDPVRDHFPVTRIWTLRGSIFSVWATCTTWVPSQKPIAAVK